MLVLCNGQNMSMSTAIHPLSKTLVGLLSVFELYKRHRRLQLANILEGQTPESHAIQAGGLSVCVTALVPSRNAHMPHVQSDHAAFEKEHEETLAKLFAAMEAHRKAVESAVKRHSLPCFYSRLAFTGLIYGIYAYRLSFRAPSVTVRNCKFRKWLAREMHSILMIQMLRSQV